MPDPDDVDLAAALAERTGHAHEDWIRALAILGHPPGGGHLVALAEGAARMGDHPVTIARALSAMTTAPATTWTPPEPDRRRWWHALLRIRGPRRQPNWATLLRDWPDQP